MSPQPPDSPFLTLKVVIKSFFKIWFCSFSAKSQYRHPWPQNDSLTSRCCVLGFIQVKRLRQLLARTSPLHVNYPCACYQPGIPALEAILIFSIIFHSVQTRLLTVLRICLVSLYLSSPSCYLHGWSLSHTSDSHSNIMPFPLVKLIFLSSHRILLELK